jgi:hypothetical protein
MRPTAPEQHEASLISRSHGRDREGCIRPRARRIQASRWASFPPLPGFQAYIITSERIGEGRALPGFRASSYRDSGHTLFADRYRADTGISGMPLPGFEPQGYREVGHGRAGSWGTNEPAATGISGMNRGRNPASPLGNPSGNFVFNNSCNNTSTQCADFLVGGRGR